MNYSLELNENEIEHLRGKHPVLLGQMVSYGCERNKLFYRFYNMTERLWDEAKRAIEDREK